MEKETRKNIWINARLILMIIAVIFLFSFSAKRNSDRNIKKTEVIFIGNDELFITHETVNKLLIEKNQSVQKPQKVAVDLNKLENSLDNYNMIEKSEVFISIDGVLKAFVKQKSPIARVFDENGSFYFDYQGNKMPLSENFTASEIDQLIVRQKKDGILDIGTTGPMWLTTKVLKRQQYFDLWEMSQEKEREEEREGEGGKKRGI